MSIKNLDTTKQETANPLTGFYTREQLEAAFDKVRNPNDWKAPVDGYCRAAEVELVREAVIFFTATEPSFYSVGINTGLRRVLADGYRKGPAGP